MNLKISLFAACLLLGVLLQAASPLQAQDPYVCDPGDCPGGVWEPTNGFLSHNSSFNGCDYEVLYRVREGLCNGNPRFDIQIITLIMDNSPVCQAVDIPAILEFAARDLLIQNPMGWTIPLPPACLVGVRVYMSGCWRRIENPPTFPSEAIITPCYESTCCRFNYRLCGQGTDPVLVSAEPGECPPSQPPDCVSICL